MHPVVLAVVTTHSTGVNLAQAAATWIPIVSTLVGLVLIARHGLGGVVDNAMKIFGATMQVKFNDMEAELRKVNERIDRVDRNTQFDSN